MKRQRHILRVLSSICVGIMVFCIALPILLLVGGIVPGPSESDVLIPPSLVGLIIISVVVSVITAIHAGKKYYRNLNQ